MSICVCVHTRNGGGGLLEVGVEMMVELEVVMVIVKMVDSEERQKYMSL